MSINNEGLDTNPYQRMRLRREDFGSGSSTTAATEESKDEVEEGINPEVLTNLAIDGTEYKPGITEEQKADVDAMLSNIDKPLIEPDKGTDYWRTATRPDVIKKYRDQVEQMVAGTGIHADTLFTQLFTESDIRRDGSQNRVSAGIEKGYNPFNIKQYKNSGTSDIYYHDDDEPTASEFIKYGSFEEGLQGYVDFLQRNPRYKSALAASTPEEQLQLIANEGFASKEGYSDILLQVLRKDVKKQKFFRGGLIYLKNG